MAVKKVLSDVFLRDEWAKIVSSSSSLSPKATYSTGQALMLKMLHSHFKETPEHWKH